MPYTMKTLPDYIKKKPKEVQDKWLKAFNAAFAEKGETYAFKVANAAIKESLAGNDIFSKTLLSELLADIDLIITRAGDGLKGREGSPIVRAFLKEVKTKVKNMIAKITDKETKALAESIVAKIEEADKQGSFGDIEGQVRAALKTHPLFPEKVGEIYMDGPYIRDMYPDRCVISYSGKLYEMEYSIMNEAVILGTPKEVIEQYVPANEAQPAKETFKESLKFTDLRESTAGDIHVAEFVSLKEAKFNDDFSEVEVVLIEAGVNEMKKRAYPDKTIREAGGIFAGMKMYINHPTPTEEKERPERNLKDWASTIVESHYDSGKAIGRVAIHDTWLRERLADPVARGQLGLSILMGGKFSVGRVNGKDGYQIVEQIVPKRKSGPASVDWVTEAGARGRVSRLMESRGGRKMELENATLKDIKESRSDLVEAIKTEAAAGNTEKVTKLEGTLKEANDKIAAFEKTQKIAAQAEISESVLKDAKIPEPCKDKIRLQVKGAVIEGDVKEAIGKMVAAELDFVNKLTPKGKIKTGANQADGTLMESLGSELDKRAGVVEKKEETAK